MKASREERLLAIGEWSTGLAHDLRNTLGGLVLRLGLVSQAPCSPAQLEHLRVVERGLRDAMGLLERLQRFAVGRRRPPGETAELGEVLSEAASLARLANGETRIIVPAGPLPRVAGSRAELKHVFLNLFLNAGHAMPGGGTVRVRARSGPSAVVVTVSDEGPGIPASSRERVFEPFFTTKGKRGLGLGLSLARGVVEGAGGSITLGRGRARGAVFRVALKKESARKKAAAPKRASAPDLRSR